MESVEAHGALLSWDPEARRLVMRFTDEASRPTELAARSLVTAAERWIGSGGAPFTVLVDCGRLAETTPGWRAAWGAFVRAHAREATVAWFRANAFIRATILVFVMATGVNGRAFRTERDARAWLEGREVTP